MEDPVDTGLLTNVVSASIGDWTAAAITNRGELWTWGDNYYWTLGDHWDPQRFVPRPVRGMPATLLVASGATRMLALVSSGQVKQWGALETANSLPVDIPGLILADTSWLTGDADEDGVPTFREYWTGTDPLDADSNDDGVADGIDTVSGLDRGNPDYDGDGLANDAELLIGTDPFASDTDGDGVADSLDRFPLDSTRTSWPEPNPLDTTPPVITLIEPTTARPIPPP